MKIVEIVWRDHSTTHGWSQEIAVPMTIREVGYLAGEKDDYYCLVDSEVIGDEGPGTSKWGCSTAILKSDVISIREIGDASA